MSDNTNSYRTVFSFSLPLVLSMAATTVMEFTDRVFLANYSIEAIAAALPGGITAFLFSTVKTIVFTVYYPIGPLMRNEPCAS